MLVATVVTCPRVAFGVLVLHDRAEGIEDGLRCEIFRRDKVDEVFLPVGFSFQDREDLRVCLFQMSAE